MSAPIMPERSLIRHLLASIGMDVPDEQIVQVPGGTVNTVTRIVREDEPDWYLRIAPNDVTAEAGPVWMTPFGLRREQAAFMQMPELADLHPATIHTDWSRSLIDSDWVIQRAVPGTSWASLMHEISDEGNRALWKQLGEISHKLHSINGREFGAPEQGLGQGRWSELARWDVTGFRVDAQRFGMDVAPFEALVNLVDQSADVLDEVTEPRLIHSDLGPRHVFIQHDTLGAPVITGLIDWEFARFADPWSESIPVQRWLGELPEDAFAAFTETYGAPPSNASFSTQMQIYAATSLGWTATDLMRLGRVDEIPAVVQRLSNIVNGTESGSL